MSDVVVVGPGGPQIAAAIAAALPSCDVTVAADAASLGTAADTATGLVAFPDSIVQPLIDRMPRLRWLQFLSSGTDRLAALTLPPALRVTNASGVHAPQMSELIFLYMLAFARDIRAILADQAAHAWRPGPQRTLVGRHIVIVGIGAIGEALALRCAAFGMRVTGLSASRTAAPGFDHVRPMHELADAARAADMLVVLTPLTPRTARLVDAAVIAALPRHAVLINVARGGVVDEPALIAALRERRIAGAGLDVFAIEPLPADSALWALDNVIVTPHVGGWSDIMLQQLAPLVVENVRRWSAGPDGPLLNEVRR